MIFDLPRLPKEEPANTSPEAVALRVAAQEFAKHRPDSDPHDRLGIVLNRKLLRAAIAYARTANGSKPEVTP